MKLPDYFEASIQGTYLTRSVQTGCTRSSQIDGTDESCQDPFRMRRVCENDRESLPPGREITTFLNSTR